MTIGIDIIEVSRIDNLKSKNRFLSRCFTARERAYIEEKNFNSRTIAGMFSAKESILKALGVGLAQGLSLADLEILHDGRKKPYLNMEGPRLKAYCDKEKIGSIDISISHDGAYAISSAQLKKKDSYRFDWELLSKLAPLKEDGHKGDMGKVLVIGGSKDMVGAVYLASQAALRMGAGLVYVLVPQSIGLLVQSKATEQIVRTLDDRGEGHFLVDQVEGLAGFIEDMDAIAIGPGMGRQDDNLAYLAYLLENYKGPLLIDADGLNSLAGRMDLLGKKKNVYLTPHHMEFSRLTGLGLEEIKGNRKDLAKTFAHDHKLGLLLKGKNSLVTDGQKLYINKTGNEGMATAGSGDVLTGMALALLARNDSLTSLELACHIHGLAGDYGAGKYSKRSLIASDLIASLPPIMKMLEEKL